VILIYTKDPEFIELVLNSICPYSDHPLTQSEPGHRQCPGCGFEIFGNPYLLAYKVDEPKTDHTPTRKCSECKTEHLKYEEDQREIVCQDCGLVIYGQNKYVAGKKINYFW
jgi:DNA-directed RNA polymerase subunit RPC12/RpoP